MWNCLLDFSVNTVIFPPIARETISKTTPPKSCEIPVIQNGEVPFALLPLIIIEITVQSDAAIIKISPVEKP